MRPACSMSGASQEEKDLSEGEVSSPESEDESGDQVSEDIDVSTMSPEDRIAYEQARYEVERINHTGSDSYDQQSCGTNGRVIGSLDREGTGD